MAYTTDVYLRLLLNNEIALMGFKKTKRNKIRKLNTKKK
jgi:hypothetical protein